MAKIKDVQTYIKKKNLDRPENIIKGVDPVAISLVKQMYSALKDRGDNLVLYERAWLSQIEKIYKDQDTYDTFFLHGLESLLKQAYQILTSKSKSWDIIEEEILAIAEKIIFLKVREDVYKGFFDNVESTLISALQFDFSNRVKLINIGNSKENIFTYKAVMINTLLETLEGSVVSMHSVNEVLNTLPGVITIITNKQGHIRYINTLGENLFGNEVSLKKQIAKVIPGLQPIIAQFNESGKISNVPFDFVIGKDVSESLSTIVSVSICRTSPILEEIIYVIRINKPRRDHNDLDLNQKLHDKVTPINTLLEGLDLLSDKLIDADSKNIIDHLKKTASRLKENTNEELKLIAFNSKKTPDANDQ